MTSGYPDWLRAFTMVGKHDSEYKAVLVDVDGNLYALLQGMTPADELQTIRLDAQGRLSAFVIDSTDAWGQMLSIGNAELAARLGSPVIYEQAGRLQFLETFEQGLGLWVQATDGLGAGIAIDPVYSRSGGYSVKLTGGRTDDRYAQLTYRQGVAPLQAMGVAFAYSSPTNFGSITMMIDMWDATTFYQAGIKLDGVTKKAYVYEFGEVWQEVLSVDPRPVLASTFFFVKFTFDPATGFYKELRLNQLLEVLSAYRFYTVPVGGLPVAQLELRLTSRAGLNDIVYFDDIILTTAEP